MRATCGVMSARSPRVRPLSLVDQLEGLRGRARAPVPDSSDSMCSSSGGMTSSKPKPAAVSSKPRLQCASMCRASAGKDVGDVLRQAARQKDMRKGRGIKKANCTGRLETAVASLRTAAPRTAPA